MQTPQLISNGRKGELAEQVGIPHLLPHKDVLKFSADEEDRFTEETGGGPYGKLYPEYNGIKLNRTFPVEAARLKSESILRYFRQNRNSDHGIPPVFMTQDIACSVFAGGEWYVFHKPATQKDCEEQTKLFMMAAETDGIIAYHAGISVAHLGSQSIRKMYGVETILGPIRKDFSPEKIIAIQRKFPQVTAGLDVTQVLEQLVEPNSTISIALNEYNPDKTGRIVSGTVMLPDRTDRSSAANSSEILHKIARINHGFEFT
jgi:hypothetical protein